MEEFKVRPIVFRGIRPSAGYTMNATTVRRQQEYHGSVYEFLRNDILDASNFVSLFGQAQG